MQLSKAQALLILEAFASLNKLEKLFSAVKSLLQCYFYSFIFAVDLLLKMFQKKPRQQDL